MLPGRKFFLKPKVIVLVLVGILVLAGLGIGGCYFLKNNKQPSANNILKTEVKSIVKSINGVPRILVNGEDKIKTINFIYSYVPLEGDDYSDGKWLAGVKEQIDGMPKLGANTLVLIVWWAELSEAQGSINFAPLDAAMKYAEQKGIYVVLTPKTTVRLPDWWAKENNFPGAGAIVTIPGIPPQVADPCIPKEKNATQACVPKEICAAGDSRCCSVPKDELYCCLRDTSVKTVFAKNGLPSCLSTTINPKYTTCTDCETDSYGWKYNSPAYGSEKFRQDYGSFITALVNRYKSSPSLIGWMLQLGPSGEDQYGPSYIYLEPIYGVGASMKLDQVADYSDNSQQLFKKWIKTKYKSDAEIQAAWGDSSITLDTVKLPDPRKLFKDEFKNISIPSFPDDFSLHYFVELSDLTQAGRDLYDFRESNRNYDRDYFSKIFKENDKNHILIYIGGNNDAIYNSPYIDAIDSQNHVEYAVSGNNEANFIAIGLAQNKKHGKASTFGIESVIARPDYSKGANFDNEQQKNALIHAGQTILCNGGYFGYASEIRSMVPNGQPAWSSTQEKEALSELASYTPPSDCVCKLTPSDGNVLGRYTIARMAQILGLSDFSKCVSSSTPSQNLSQPQTDMEKCMQDCMKGGKQQKECESECGAPPSQQRP
jgi:hypothetical protein